MKNSHTSCYQKFNLTWMLAIVVGVLMVTATSCSDSGITGSDDSEGFTESWSKSGIEEGTTSIDGSADSLMLNLDTHLQFPKGDTNRN